MHQHQKRKKISRFFSTSFFLLLRYIPPIPSFCTQTNQIYLCISNFASLPKFCLYPGPIKRTQKATYYKSSNWFWFVFCFRMRLNMFSYCSLFSINTFFLPYDICHIIISIKAGSISEVFHFGSNLQKKVSNPSPEHDPHIKKLLRRVIWHLFLKVLAKVKIFWD